jgi:hypothetical protein
MCSGDPMWMHVKEDSNTVTKLRCRAIFSEDAVDLSSSLVSQQVTVLVVSIGTGGVGVCVEDKLLAGNGGHRSVLASMVGVGLMHASVDAGGAYRARCSGVLRCEASIGGVQSMPRHTMVTGMSGDHVHAVV